MTAGERRTCVLADDHPALLRTLAELAARQGLEVVAEAATGPAAVRAVEAARPELAVVDLLMPGLAGAELIERICAASPDTAVLVYTADVDAGVLPAALDAGAAGVVLKEAPLSDLGRAIETVLAGAVYVDPGLARQLMDAAPARARLTQREVEVLRLLGEGLTHDEIGARLELACDTVRTHVRKATARLGARNRTHAVATAIRTGQL